MWKILWKCLISTWAKYMRQAGWKEYLLWDRELHIAQNKYELRNSEMSHMSLIFCLSIALTYLSVFLLLSLSAINLINTLITPNKQREILNKCSVMVISKMVLHTKKPIILIYGYKSTEFSILKYNWYWIKKIYLINPCTNQIFTATSEKRV